MKKLVLAFLASLVVGNAFAIEMIQSQFVVINDAVSEVTITYTADGVAGKTFIPGKNSGKLNEFVTPVVSMGNFVITSATTAPLTGNPQSLIGLCAGMIAKSGSIVISDHGTQSTHLTCSHS